MGHPTIELFPESGGIVYFQNPVWLKPTELNIATVKHERILVVDFSIDIDAAILRVIEHCL